MYKYFFKNFRYINNQSIQKQTLIESLVLSLSPTVAVFRRSFSKQTLIETFCCGNKRLRYQILKHKMSPLPSQVENYSKYDGDQIFAPASIGITIPPPDIRSMVDKAARFVASIKPRLEKIIAKNAGMRKYTFLNAADPHHAYYQHRLSEFRAQNGSTLSADGNEKTDLFRPADKIATAFDRIQKGYERLEESYVVGNTVVLSPITGELITLNDMSQHLRDPKYKEQRERVYAKFREITLAQDEKISTSIHGLALICPDVFWTTEEEVFNAIKEYLKITCHVPRFGWTEDPEPKRQRLDDSLLVPENQFLAQHPGPVCISVWVPEKGQMLEISVESLSESVSSLKEKIAGEIEEAPPANKLKLSRTAGFFNDNLSLAYYNVAGGEILSLSW
ncbi:hypothetical protein L1987_35412 [Smallanthus sonchifolius]|uniref:Uncharacterized protein n=1 Tax=Smallanthus sonchifolius TaxID=185202 RepID=A0ACB9HWI3_9ASTR|nr:hypothetical protein L1987_35412 [Smallanthus sonchifolius]